MAGSDREAEVILTAELLQAAVGCSAERAALFASHLTDACETYQIDTPLRLAHFLAQIGHESGSLAHVREVWGPTPAQERYEGRVDLGNTQAGDGRRFMGRGLLQTTGRSNYRALRDRLRSRGVDCPDFEAEPDRLEHPRWAALSAADYWEMRGINRIADRDDHEAVTKAVNGGINGLEDRRRRLKKALVVLEESPPVYLGPELQVPPTAPRPDIEPYTQETPMVAPVAAVAGTFLWELAKSAISVFTPLAQEKITKELNRHTNNPAVASQVASAIIDTAKAATGKTDPMEAVVEARKSPVAVQKMETSALDELDRLMPVLEKMQKWESDAWAAEEESRRNADARAVGAENDQDVFLTRSIVALVIGLMVALITLIGILMWLKADSGTIGTLVGLFAGAGGSIINNLNSRYNHRYGSSRGSAAKDVLAAELARRPVTQ